MAPQTYSNPSHYEGKETISWVRFDHCDINDLAQFRDKIEVNGNSPPLLLIIGYVCGVQVRSLLSSFLFYDKFVPYWILFDLWSNNCYWQFLILLLGMGYTCEWGGHGGFVMAARSCAHAESFAYPYHIMQCSWLVLLKAPNNSTVWYCWSWSTVLLSFIYFSKNRGAGELIPSVYAFLSLIGNFCFIGNPKIGLTELA